MTTMREATSHPREIGLQAEAATVERLRRQIAEMAGRGEPASPQLLAEFARVQKAYLDKKIGFEKQRRGVATEVRTDEIPTAPKPQAMQAERTAGERPTVASDLPEAAAKPAPARTRLIVILLLLAGAIAAAAWYFLQAR
jgi:hypothetical protein